MSPALWLLSVVVCSFNPEPTATAVPRTVIASVHDRPIYADEVERLVKAAVGRRSIEPAAKAWLQARAREQLINQRLVEQFLARAGLSASEAEIRSALDHVKADAEAARLDYAALLAQRGVTEEQLREQFRWELSWKKYLAREINDQALQKHFEAHRRQFDGSELRVSQILLRTATEAAELREQIVAGKIPFADAAKRHSTSPTAAQGGDLGFIARHGAMTEEFSRAAFTLNPGEVSPPVATQFGVHLIQVTEVRLGNKQWTDVREEVRLDLAQRLFEAIAERERPKATMRTGP